MSEAKTFTSQGVRVAVEGCGHGTLNAIYAAVDRSCKARNWDGVDVLIIGGDFQAVRNAADLTVMSVPLKYRELGDFHEYYSGVRKAPYLTLFVAGNHEASSHLWELYYGGWVAPNIYYMGAANVLRLGPLRICGMSGIWKGFDYRKPHHERLPFNGDDIKSFYHIREFDVRKLLQVRTQVDIGIGHDWPRAIERHGNERHLFNMKPDFEQESRDGSLGNPAATYVMDRLRPPYWFSAHMHCKFTAIKTYELPKASNETAEETPTVTAQETAPLPVPVASSVAPVENPDEIDLGLDDDEEASPAALVENKESEESKGEEAATKDNNTIEALRAKLPASFARPQQQPQQPKTTPGQPVPAGITNTTVRFLALDKCLPGRKFLQLCEISPFDANNNNTTSTEPTTSPTDPLPTVTTTDTTSTPTPPTFTPRHTLQYDPEWLAITRVFAPHLTIGQTDPPSPDLGEQTYLAQIQAEEKWVHENITLQNKLAVPDNFAITAPPLVLASGDNENEIRALLNTHDQPEEYTNPQTEAFCQLVGVDNLWDAGAEERAERRARGPREVVHSGGHGHGQRGGGGGGGYRGGGRGGWRGGRGGGGGGGGGGRGGRGGRGRGGGRGGGGRGGGRGGW